MRRLQFSLSTLLLAPLVLSPLLIALREWRNIAKNHHHDLGAATVVLGFIYVVILTLVEIARRRPTTPRSLPRWVLRSTVRGALYGLLYYMLIFFPIAAADQYYIYWQRSWQNRLAFFTTSMRDAIAMGLAVGITTGCAVGLITWIFSRRRSSNAAAAEENSPESNPASAEQA
jgi:hypothetical protein